MANARQGVSGLSAGDSEKNNRRTYDSPELFGELREVFIEHAGKEYRLRITSNEKLILTK
ncbi:hemin uptake protein HemP [Desulfuromonas sp. AOP6]|uniref:hemin uptake protein HemP n=1 Tax=Desulfuromonas sp. AOP6 TaxID=1566351 RepID=UPI0012785F08|nr:hemin uptake protein HemP [Desulfuromonas sp. AOP6]BCA79038.1 hypothetical protein AOP6_0825 [Desulfuromonas sp. AOP6]